MTLTPSEIALLAFFALLGLLLAIEKFRDARDGRKPDPRMIKQRTQTTRQPKEQDGQHTQTAPKTEEQQQRHQYSPPTPAVHRSDHDNPDPTEALTQTANQAWQAAHDAAMSIINHKDRAIALSTVATAARKADQNTLATQSLAAANEAASIISNDKDLAYALAEVITAASAAGQTDLATQLVAPAQHAADSVTESSWIRDQVQAEVAIAAANAGAWSTVRKATNISWYYPEAAVRVAKAAAICGAAGQTELAAALLAPLTEGGKRSDTWYRIGIWPHIATAATTAGVWTAAEAASNRDPELGRVP